MNFQAVLSQPKQGAPPPRRRQFEKTLQRQAIEWAWRDYNRPMRFTTIFFDLDDTLYPPGTNLWEAIKGRMNDYMRARMDIPENEIPILREKYFLEYGTTLRGLQANHKISTDEFLAYGHDLSLKDYLTPNPTLRAIIASLPTRNLIFTNAATAKARRAFTAIAPNHL